MNHLHRAGFIALLFAGAACDSAVLAPEAAEQPEVTAQFAALKAGAQGETQDVMAQGGLGVYAADGAKVVRQPHGFRASVTMPAPAPGSYTYAPGTIEGHPEVFTLWAFVFNHPELCNGPCNGDDLGMDKPAQGGAYNVGGVVSSGGSLTISGRIRVGEDPFRWAPLAEVESAEIHLAVAPHGALDPQSLPSELRLPAGSGACACWWVAIFE